jgi:hypothetical protein
MEYKNGMLHITPDLMLEVKKSMEEKGISTELLKGNKVDVFQMIIKEDELSQALQ